MHFNCFYFKVCEKVANSMVITELEASNWTIYLLDYLSIIYVGTRK